MTSNQEENDSKTIEHQRARAILRESFLKAISELTGKSCSVLTYEKSSLQGKFSGWKPDGSEVLMRDLETPSNCTMDIAVLRSPDILTIKFEGPIQLP